MEKKTRVELLTIFDIARRFFGVINVISNVALKFGSSQHGNARRQSAG
jgi:hypothetical protein